VLPHLLLCLVLSDSQHYIIETEDKPGQEYLIEINAKLEKDNKEDNLYFNTTVENREYGTDLKGGALGIRNKKLKRLEKENMENSLKEINLRGDSLTPKMEFEVVSGPLEKPPAKETPPQCLKPPCHKKIVKTKIYINDDLWKSMQRLGTKSITKRIEEALINVNRDLSRLDNGGYKVVNENPPTKLSTSDVTMKKKYKDRIDSNTVKIFDKNDIFAQGFSFQEAVEELSNRNDVDVRILLIPYSSRFDRRAVAEEYCVCKPTGFGCVIVLTIRNPADWSVEWKVFTHEIGHTLGAMHDDEGYEYDNKLIMWPVVGTDANIWSPVARKGINQQDHSCLGVKNKKDSGKKKKSKEEMEYIKKWLRNCYLKYSQKGCRNYSKKHHKEIVRTM